MPGQRSPFGAELRRLRLERSWSQSDLADRIDSRLREMSVPDARGLSSKQISNLERERAHARQHVRPQPGTVRAIAAGLGLREGDADYQRLVAMAAAMREPDSGPTAVPDVHGALTGGDPRVISPVDGSGTGSLPVGIGRQIGRTVDPTVGRTVGHPDASLAGPPGAGPDESGRIAVALRHVTRGNEDFASFEVRSAHFRYQLALSLLPESPSYLAGVCCQQLALTLRWLGHREDAKTFADRAINAGEVLGQPTLTLTATIVRSLLDIETDRPREAAVVLLEITRRDPVPLPTEDQVFLFNVLAYAQFRAGDYGGCTRHALDASRLARACGNVGGEAEGLMQAANCHTDCYSFERALDLYFRARALQEISGDERGLAVSNLNTALCYIYLDRRDLAAEFLQQAEQFAISRSGEVTRATVYHYRGMLLENAGSPDDAIHNYYSAAMLRQGFGPVAQALESRLYCEHLKQRSGYADEDMSEAVAAVERHLTTSRTDGLEDSARVFAVCITWLDETGEPDRAARMLALARADITARVDAMNDALLRHHYTRNNPWVQLIVGYRMIEPDAV